MNYKNSQYSAAHQPLPPRCLKVIFITPGPQELSLQGGGEDMPWPGVILPLPMFSPFLGSWENLCQVSVLSSCASGPTERGHANTQPLWLRETGSGIRPPRPVSTDRKATAFVFALLFAPSCYPALSINVTSSSRLSPSSRSYTCPSNVISTI